MDILKKIKKFRYSVSLRALLWFLLGASLGLFFFSSFIFIFYRNAYETQVYPGVYVDGVDFGGKTQQEVEEYFNRKNDKVAGTTFTLKANDMAATASAAELEYGYDSKLLAQQAFSIGRSESAVANLSLVFQAYTGGIHLPPAYRYSEDVFAALTAPMKQELSVKPVDANFTFENGRVLEFRSHSNGQEPELEKTRKELSQLTPTLLTAGLAQDITIPVPIRVLQPKITMEKVNNMGIKELLASGTSTYIGSIPNRAYNINLSASRINGVLIKPGEIFSFVKAVGDVSRFTGYKEAYVIQNGRTVLGDGGGICQVSTTLFRAVINAGLPIVERNPHAYRVSYYEQDSKPGVDAAVYVPTLDLKFKNDTKNWILIQTKNDPVNMRLTFEIYGTKDGREVILSQPVIHSQSPAPEPLYQDDPNLPKGQEKQIDWAAQGARVSFTREVRRGNKVILSETFTSNYRPWQAVYLRGTKE